MTFCIALTLKNCAVIAIDDLLSAETFRRGRKLVKLSGSVFVGLAGNHAFTMYASMLMKELAPQTPEGFAKLMPTFLQNSHRILASFCQDTFTKYSSDEPYLVSEILKEKLRAALVITGYNHYERIHEIAIMASFQNNFSPILLRPSEQTPFVHVCIGASQSLQEQTSQTLKEQFDKIYSSHLSWGKKKAKLSKIITRAISNVAAKTDQVSDHGHIAVIEGDVSHCRRF